MAKRSIDELSATIEALDLDDEVKISLMEDISDSIADDISEEMESLKGKYEDLQKRYKARFLEGKEDPEDETEEIEEEKKIIDVKEI